MIRFGHYLIFPDSYNRDNAFPLEEDPMFDRLLDEQEPEDARDLPDTHQRGDAAPRTAEARGTSSPARDRRRERNPSDDAARAAGAQVTGQCQSGPSQVSACEQYPRAAHGGAGSSLPLSDDNAPNSNPGASYASPSRLGVSESQSARPANGDHTHPLTHGAPR